MATMLLTRITNLGPRVQQASVIRSLNYKNGSSVTVWGHNKKKHGIAMSTGDNNNPTYSGAGAGKNGNGGNCSSNGGGDSRSEGSAGIWWLCSAGIWCSGFLYGRFTSLRRLQKQVVTVSEKKRVPVYGGDGYMIIGWLLMVAQAFSAPQLATLREIAFDLALRAAFPLIQRVFRSPPPLEDLVLLWLLFSYIIFLVLLFWLIIIPMW